MKDERSECGSEMGEEGRLSAWEAQAVEAIGLAIDGWGFKRNQGRVWGILYLRGVPLAAHDLQELLGLSKGAVSMITRDLEDWGVIRRVRSEKGLQGHFVAETDLMEMIRRVIRAREAEMIAQVKGELEEAEEAARLEGGVEPEVLERLARARALALLMQQAVEVFLHTAHLNVSHLLEILDLRPSTPFSLGVSPSYRWPRFPSKE